VEGINALLAGLIAEDDRLRAMGCMGVGAVAEFGTSDPALTALRAKVTPPLWSRLVDRVREGQAATEIDPGIDAEEAAAFIQMTMCGVQLAARAGARAEDLRKTARLVVDRLKAR
jgi:TetR/AcrR family transcriptional repressor of nem operon